MILEKCVIGIEFGSTNIKAVMLDENHEIIIELSKKIPSGSFISELVDQNIRRPKKSRMR